MPKKTSASKVSKTTKTVVPSVGLSGTPSTIKWAKGLAIFQIVVGVLGLAFFIWLFSTSSMDPFIQGMQQGVMEGLGEELSSFETSAEIMGAMTALFALALVGPILVLTAISRRTKNWAISCLIFNGLSAVANASIISAIIVILMLVEPSRKYLNLNA